MQRDDGNHRDWYTADTDTSVTPNKTTSDKPDVTDDVHQMSDRQRKKLAQDAKDPTKHDPRNNTLADQDLQQQAEDEQRRKQRRKRDTHPAHDTKAALKGAKKAVEAERADKFIHNPIVQAVLHPVKTCEALGNEAATLVSHLGSMIAHGFTHLAHSAGSLLGGLVGKAASALAAATSAHTLASGVSVLLLGASTVSFGVYHLLHGDDDGFIACSTQPMTNGEATSAGAKGAIGGDWTKQGTPAYQHAQTVWNFWKSKGFSGAAIAGILGNIAREGGFTILDRAQQHYSNDEDKAGISKGVQPIGGGGGLYQFTPYTKFAPLGSNKWLDLDAQDNFVWDSEVAHAGWKSAYAHLSDVSEAAHKWFSLYERGASFDPTKVPAAQQAYQIFGGADVKANDSLLGASGTMTAAGTNDMLAQNAAAQDCGNGNGNTDLPDGTGKVNEQPPKSGGMLSYDFHSVPDDMKQFVPDPTKVGLSWGSRGGWTQEGGGGGQCPDFSVSYFHHIWSPNPPGTCSGNGKDIAENMAKMMGGSVSNTPHAGAIASAPANVAGISPGPYGHTFVVVHVLANGDIILLQQNFIHSGDNVGKKNTWEVGLCSKQEYQDNHFQFFTPDTSKYKLNLG